MTLELDHGYILQLYKRGNYGTVKREFFLDMLDVVTFTNRIAKRYINYCITLIDKANDNEVYSGCIHNFNVKVSRALLEIDINKY